MSTRHNRKPKPQYADMCSCETALSHCFSCFSFHHMFHILFSTSSFFFSQPPSLSFSRCLSLLLLHNSECVEQPEDRRYSSGTSFNWKLVLSHAHKSLERFIVPDVIFLSIRFNKFLNSLLFCSLSFSLFHSPSVQLSVLSLCLLIGFLCSLSLSPMILFHCLFFTLLKQEFEITLVLRWCNEKMTTVQEFRVSKIYIYILNVLFNKDAFNYLKVMLICYKRFLFQMLILLIEKKSTVFIVDNNKWFLKDHVKLKTGVMAATQE